jgi:hypothetical protein
MSNTNRAYLVNKSQINKNLKTLKTLQTDLAALSKQKRITKTAIGKIYTAALNCDVFGLRTVGTSTKDVVLNYRPKATAFMKTTEAKIGHYGLVGVLVAACEANNAAAAVYKEATSVEVRIRELHSYLVSLVAAHLVTKQAAELPLVV